MGPKFTHAVPSQLLQRNYFYQRMYELEHRTVSDSTQTDARHVQHVKQ